IPPTEIHDNGDDWNCHSCTFKNSGMMNMCEICNTPRPTISGPPTSLIPTVEPGTQDDRVTNDASSTTDNSSDDGALMIPPTDIHDNGKTTQLKEKMPKVRDFGKNYTWLLYDVKTNLLSCAACKTSTQRMSRAG
ncbi:unnamed protein product, partial [Meganyctiphanes norvegica]